jgi:hypothetical protein
MDTNCDLCNYLQWLLKDTLLSREKAVQFNIKRQLHNCTTQRLEGFYDDVNHVTQALHKHKALKHGAA